MKTAAGATETGGRKAAGAARVSDKGAETYDLVLRTSTQLFAERGYHGTSMRELAERGDLRPSAFYYYFASKYEVLLAIIETATELLEVSAASVPDDLDTESRVCALIEGHVRVHLGEREITSVCDRELRVLEEPDLKKIIRRLEAYEQHLRDALAEGVKEKVFPKDLDIPVAAMSILLMGTGVVEWWTPRGALSVDETAKMVAGFALSVARSGATTPEPA